MIKFKKEDLTEKVLQDLNVTVINWMRVFKELGFEIEQRKWYRVHEKTLVNTRDGLRRLGKERDMDGRFYLSYQEALILKEKYNEVKMGPPRKNVK